MSPLLLAIALLWVAPLFAASLVGLAAALFPPIRSAVREQLFGPDPERADARPRPRRRTLGWTARPRSVGARAQAAPAQARRR